MTLGRIVYMYGNKPSLYPFSICVLCFGLGCIVVRCVKNCFMDALICALILLLIIHFVDAIIKSVIFVKKNFYINVKCK